MALFDQFGVIPDLTRCTVCEKPLLEEIGEVDQHGRCCKCHSHNARRVDCDCAFLAEGEACACNDGVTRCTDCLVPTHAAESNDDGLCKRCMWRRGIAPIAEAA